MDTVFNLEEVQELNASSELPCQLGGALESITFHEMVRYVRISESDYSFHFGGGQGIVFTDMVEDGKRRISGMSISSGLFSFFEVKRGTPYWQAEDILLERGYELVRIDDGTRLLYRKGKADIEFLIGEDGKIERWAVFLNK